MTRLNKTLMIAIVCWAHNAAAQPVVRSNEPARSVTLSLAEYNRLTDLANRMPVSPPIPPVAAVLSSADLRVRVEGTTAHGVFTLAGEVLRAGVSRVTLLSGATVLEANTEGRPLPLFVEGQSHAALLPGPGPFSANLEWGAPLTLKPGRASFMLPVPPAGSVRATIDLPGDQADVRLSAGSITHRITENGRTIVEATLDPASATEVWWSMRDSVPVAAAREARTVADVMTLITLGDSDVRMVALIDLTVVQGELRTIAMRLPAGYQLTGITGSSLETSDPVDGNVVLTLLDPTARRHQFLVTLERSHHDGSFTLETDLVAIADVQRERGEVAIEGVGTLDLTASERTGLHRIDVREINAALQSLARTPLLSAFRYQRTAAAAPGLSLAVARFADAGVLAATVNRAVATTLITSEGRALTEVVLRVQNRAQPFLKAILPAGASIVSVEVAGQPAKPVLGNDGSRVPLLRPGFRPVGAYDVSFVYLHAGTPFERKGAIQMTLPRMDIPIGVVEWEVFAPGNYSLRYVDGNAVDQATLERALAREAAVARRAAPGLAAAQPSDLHGYRGPVGESIRSGNISVLLAPGEASGRIRGVAKDESGAALPGVNISVVSGGSQFAAITSGNGTFLIAEVPRGVATLTASLAGFRTTTGSFTVGDNGQIVQIVMSVGSLTESITLSGSGPAVDRAAKSDRVTQEPSQNVINLQRRIAGVLPIRVDVPHTGSSYRFSRPLVVDDETRVEFRYKRR